MNINTDNKKMRHYYKYFICKPKWKTFIAGLFAIVFLWLGSSHYFHLTPIQLAKQGSRVIIVPVFAKLYAEDKKSAELLRQNSWIGESNVISSSSLESWKHIEAQVPGFRFLGGNGSNENIQRDIPFIYESMNAQYLVELREHYQLDQLIMEAPDEYHAMLRLGAWVGTRWDHGIDPVPQGITIPHPLDIIQAGENGSKFWCEVAAKVTVNAATALGWPARLVTASRDGYTWEHALAELWSNQHRKWFVMDTDFNIVYEANGIPLSAFELCHNGLELQKTKQLYTREIAPPKPSLPLIDLLPFYRYIHIDLRNDWYSRRLRRGSPAGGDLATWWTARPSFGNILTAKIRVDHQKKFDWPVNSVNIYARSLDSSQNPPLLNIGLFGYSPFFKTFQISVDDRTWHDTKSGHDSFHLLPGKHSVKARVMTMTEQAGPVYEIQFQFF
ncbi:hypothetical protein U27_06400 [Candidatus Vecturithrix granuli]|uniref:Transglutaminase-like domain-containing protein n=1 Tax=Vecturithrix granuli TaxID=1499967 RepID=A0A081C4B1_VECG1|nr:hypothetical protein U27_06400 [Candidatus Vecturithrix granuli]